jgi:hypothetical protein
MVRIERQENLGNHRLRLSFANAKILLDNPLGLYLPYENCAKGLSSNARKIHLGSRVNRGADSHDE